jgi:MFS family permease
VAALALSTSALAPTLPVLAVGVLLTGAASAVFHLARQSFLTDVTPVVNRARVLSTLGGVARIGAFLGPFLGAALLHVAGLRSVFWLAVGTTVLAGLVVLLAPDVEGRRGRPRTRPVVPTGTLLRRHARLLGTLGIAVVLVGAVRASRQVVLPLWSEHLGLAPATTSLVFGLAGAVDMLLFYPAGKVMDRRGRLWVAVPSMLVLGGAHPHDAGRRRGPGARTGAVPRHLAGVPGLRRRRGAGAGVGGGRRGQPGAGHRQRGRGRSARRRGDGRMGAALVGARERAHPGTGRAGPCRVGGGLGAALTGPVSAPASPGPRAARARRARSRRRRSTRRAGR